MNSPAETISLTYPTFLSMYTDVPKHNNVEDWLIYLDGPVYILRCSEAEELSQEYGGLWVL